MAEEKVDGGQDSELVNWKPSRGWKHCEGCQEVDDQDCLDEPCGRFRVEAEAKLAAAEKELAFSNHEDDVAIQERDKRIAELEAKLAAAEARATAFFEEGVKKAAVIADREAAIKAFEKENAKLRMELRLVEAEAEIYEALRALAHTTTTFRSLLDGMKARNVMVDKDLHHHSQSTTKSTPTPKKRH